MTEPREPYRNPLAPDFGERVTRSDITGLAELFLDPLDPGYAAAARRRAVAGGPPPLRRMRAVTLVALVAVGLLLAVAYRQVVAEEPTRAEVRADLEDQIHQRQSATEQLEQQADALRGEVAELRDQLLPEPQVRQLRELEAGTGLGRVRGDGVVVRVADGEPGVDPQTGEPLVESEAQILDQDLQRVVNALWAAGAEAVAVNDRRLTATSTIRGAGGPILVNRQPIAGPYQVAAIGPDDLQKRFADSPTAALLRLLVDKYGITYELQDAEELTLPAAGEPQLEHATTAGGD